MLLTKTLLYYITLVSYNLKKGKANMKTDYEKALELLKKNGQEQLLVCYDKMSEADKQKLLNQILSIDFDLIKKLYDNTNNIIQKSEDKIEPISYIDKSKLKEEEKTRLGKIGAEVIKAGKLAALTMAGGQGTRLGHKGPKGTFKLGLTPDKSLFEILCDTLKDAYKKYGIYVKWYIMTSNENNAETVEFFEKNNYFDYPKNKIKFFIQGELPMLDENGKILVDEQGFVKLAADGHGGVFESMFNGGILDDMTKNNIEWVFIGGIDNVLVKMVDETIMGIAEENHCLAVGKSVVKANPQERVGVFCTRNGKPSVVEYTEITEEMANETDKNNELVYGESHILCNLFNIARLEKISQSKLPYHAAHKKATYINSEGKLIVPDKPNAYKYESFIFDAFSSLDSMAVLRVKREEEFAPVKNAEGVDSPDTARKLYKDFYGIK